ncbi:hypothetical protein GC101_22000 [Paenibacillus sp. LMG 31459]|uniref:Fibronectin type-III domain-containing protein n=2 Tax=Paenibacillus phytohabitans TaxID=2654978 RepID=A0ABX1YLY2_9BACL|nr:hypothetical protein [Paenibacillus phytohabitans]
MISIVLFKPGETYALPGGLLNGKVMVLSSNGTSNFLDQTGATDNNGATYVGVSWSGGARNTLSYTVPSKSMNIKDVQMSSSGGYFFLRFYNSSNVLLKEYNTPSNGNGRFAVNINNVSRVEVRNQASNGMNIYEFDLFGEIDLSIPQNLKATVGTKAADLHWDALTDTDLAGYNVYVNGIKVNTSLVTTNMYHLPDLVQDVEYTAYVSAVYVNGDESQVSKTVKFTPYDDPIADVTLTVVPYVDRLVFNWNSDPQAVSYTLRDSVTGSVVWTGATGFLSYSFTGLEPNITKTVYVVAADKYGRTVSSQTVSGTTLEPPPPVDPVLSLVSTDYKSVTLKWTGIGLLYNILNTSGELQKTSAGTYATITDLQPDTQYSYYVVSTDIYGRKTQSNVLTVKTGPIPAAVAPSVKFLSVTSKSARAIWNSVGDSYKVYLNDAYVATTSSLYYQLNDLQPNTAYTVKIVSLDAFGREVPGSGTFTTSAAPPTPTPGNGSGGNGGGPGGGGSDPNWTPPPVADSGNPDLDKPTDTLVDGANGVKDNGMSLILMIITVLILMFGAMWLIKLFKKKTNMAKPSGKMTQSTSYRPKATSAKSKPALNLSQGSVRQSRSYTPNQNQNSRRKYYVEKTYPSRTRNQR